MELGWWGVLIAVLGGAIRIGTPFLFVSLGECLTEKSGRINLGLEGTLVMGAMAAYGVSYLTNSPWLGVLAAGERHRRGDRADAVRRRPGLFPRQTAGGADRAALAGGVARVVVGLGAGPFCPAGERAVRARPRHHGGGAVPAPAHPLGPHPPHGRRERRHGARHGLRRGPGTPAGHDGRWFSGLRLRIVPLALLSGQLERRALQRAGIDGRRAGDLRALGSRALPLGLA